MAINLTKGERVSLDNSVKFALVGLGWDTNKYCGTFDFDLDASVFMLGANDKLLRDEDFVFYNNPNGRNGAVVHGGDNRTGEGDGDDEVITINFVKIPQEIVKLVVCVTIHQAEERRQNFGQVGNAYVRLAKLTDEFDNVGEPVLKFDLEDEFSIETGLVVAEIYRSGMEWKFKAVAGGVRNGLLELCQRFGAGV